MMYSIETDYSRKGNILCGHAKITGPRGVRNVTVCVPIPPGASFSVDGEPMGDEVGWFGSSIMNAATKLTKNAVVNKLGSAVKSVIKSDITKVAVSTLAVAFPPVGVPAAAAYATAATVMSAADTASKYAGAAKAAGDLITKNPAEALRMGLEAAKSGNPQDAVSKLLAIGAKQGGLSGIKAVLGQVQAKARAGVQAKKVIAETITRHQKGDKEATKFLKTLVVAKQANQKLAQLKNAVATNRQSRGILVLPSGELLRGSFATAGAQRL